MAMPRPSRRAVEPRHFTHGSRGATPDSAPDAAPRPEDRHPDAPHSQPATRLGKSEMPDQLADKEAVSEDRQEALLDEGVEESFPASDPVSVHHIT